MGRFYVGDFVKIKEGEHASARWNLYEMRKYVDNVVRITDMVDRVEGMSENDRRFYVSGKRGFNHWTWTGEDFILVKKACVECEKEAGDEFIVNGVRYCKECYERHMITCEICGKKEFARTVLMASGKTLCRDCYGTKTTNCPTCERKILKDYSYEDEYGNNFCNEHCSEIYCLENHYMKDYSEKPIPVFFGDKKELHIGVELEIDTRGDDYGDSDALISELSGISGKHFCKYDGSLGEYGVEIVTQPCTLDYHMNNFGWKDITRICKNYDYYSDMVSTCGMHMHVDKSYFENSKEAAVKLTYLLNKFRENFITFSRRRSGAISDWANFVDIEEIGNIENQYSLIDGRRYLALNVCNKHTFEFRIWKGSLNIETIFATMQMTQVLCDIVKNEEDIENITWVDICNYGNYEQLKSYLLRRNLIRAEELKENIAA